VSRPTKPIELDQLAKLAIFHCTDEEIASFFGITARTLRRRKQNRAFAAVLENGRNNGKIALRHLQFEKAREGHPTMLIWLGKQIPGQRDHLQQPNRPSAAPIPVQQVRSKILGLLAKRAAHSGTQTAFGEAGQATNNYALVKPAHRVQTLFEVSGVRDMLIVFPDLDGALNAFGVTR
jgi:hypothetical protein